MYAIVYNNRRSRSPCVALYKCGSTPGPISEITSALSPTRFFTASPIIPVVVTITSLWDLVNALSESEQERSNVRRKK